MTNRTTKLTLSILVLICLAILALSLTGVLPSGDGAGTSGSSQTSAGEPAAGTTGSASASQATTAPLVTGPLPVETGEPEPTPALGLRRWPAHSCLPVVRQPDLSAYIGKADETKPLQGITVILDAGHGGHDGGTSCADSSGRTLIVEKDVTLAVSLQAQKILTDYGATVYMTRSGDDWLSVYNRIAQTGKWILDRFIAELPGRGYSGEAVAGLLPQLEAMIAINSDAADSGGRGLMLGVGASADARLLLDIQNQYPDVVLISLHCNAYAGDSAVSGLQVYYLTNESNYSKEIEYVQYSNSADNPPAYTLYDDTSRQELAMQLRDSILNQFPELKFTGENDLLAGDYAILREMNLVSALVEMGFVTSPDDRRILLDPDCQRRIAQGVADAVINYYCGQ